MITCYMRDPKDPGLDNLCRFLFAHGCTGAMYEIGSCAGESAEIFSRYFAIVDCVDPWARPEFPSTIEDSFDERAAAAGNIRKHKSLSLDVAPTVADGSLDFVYIDGDHSYEMALADMRAWWPKVKAGAFLGGHDWILPDVKRAVLDFLGREPDRLFDDNATSWVARK